MNRLKSLFSLWHTEYVRLIRVGQYLKYMSPYKAYNVVIAELSRITGVHSLRSYPYFYSIDPTNVCNLRCPLCTTSKGANLYPKHTLPYERFVRIVNEIAPYAMKLYLHKWGEPFLHANIISMITYAHSKNIATLLSTNLNVMPPEGAESLVLSGLDDLVISCDGRTQETYEIYRVGGKLETLKQNLKTISDCKKRLLSRSPRIEFQFLVFEHNEHEVPMVEATALSWGADIVRICSPYLDFHTPGRVKPAKDPRYVRPEYVKLLELNGEVEVGLRKKALGKKSCFFPWRAIIVNSDGQIDPCGCYRGDKHFGNIFNDSLKDIWNSEPYQYARCNIFGKLDKVRRYPVVCEKCPGMV